MPPTTENAWVDKIYDGDYRWVQEEELEDTLQLIQRRYERGD
jgi:hypothetical protein